jgi:Ca2+-transporting ATPase
MPSLDARAGAHERPLPEIVAALATDVARGLDPAEARRRLARDGRNEIRGAAPVSALAIVAGQFRSIVIWVLIGAAGVSVALGEIVDGAAILAIVVLNAVIGAFQEYRAERAVAALARLTAPRAKVVRGSAAVQIPAAEVVSGDVLLLEAGDLVAADGRLVDSAVLRTSEASLTGESEPIAKAVTTCAPETALADRANMVFLGTSVASGTGRAIVVGTGMATEIGRIATLLESASHGTTPLQQQLDGVGRRLLWACLAIVVVVFAIGLLRAVPPLEMFLAAVSLAVAAIPEGLPAVVTLALALGVQRMVRRHALVRRLPAVETLGCAQVICSDKTGTLTVGAMTARKLVTSGAVYTVSGEGYATEGGIFRDGTEASAARDPMLADLLRAAVGCVDAELGERDGRPVVVGDPTEGALLVVAAKAGVDRARLEAEMPRRATIPFDSDRKRMAVIRERDGRPWAFVKGAPEVVLARCASLRTTSGVSALDAAQRASMLEASAVLAADALRVLAIAERALPSAGADPDAVERDLTLLGLVGLQDPPRAEAREAVAKCRRAGIRPVMITGDHPDTARAIARELGILEHGEVLIGREIERLDDAALAERVERTTVYARVTAEHKLRIVRAWKARGAVVAMTGDGVNDAPALKEAAIGIAMGITGTEVTKEAADMVITDDNFASIVDAIEEGRGIYDNIAKTLTYLLGGNAGELGVMLLAALAGTPLPLLPVQLLWVNLVTDGLPALALATDTIDPDVLQRPPRRPDAQLTDRTFLGNTVFIGCLTATVTLAAFGYELYRGHGGAAARSAAFAVLVFEELLRSFSARSDTRTVWELGLFSNLRLVAVVALTLVLQLAIHATPGLRAVFGTQAMSFGQCAAWLALAALPVSILEVRKLLRRRSRPYPIAHCEVAGDRDRV